MLKEGLIIKGIGGFYTVLSEGETFVAKGIGAFKNKGLTLMVGDRVKLEIRDDGDSVIREILPRKNQFIRPPIANVDVFVITASCSKPKVNFDIVDKFLIMAEKEKAKAILCFNKADEGREDFVNKVKKIYKDVCPIYFVSGKTEEGIDDLRREMLGGLSAFAGPSGVGKSTIINKLVPHANMETGTVSKKTSRGKHTTRHVEIFSHDSLEIFDTPGFTSFQILDVDEDELSSYYPEFSVALGKCKFSNCRHRREPGCKVIEAVEKGLISEERYRSYLRNLEEISSKKQN